MKNFHCLVAMLGIIICSASLLDDYEPCSSNEVNNDDEIQDVLNYGTDQLYETAVQEGKVQTSTYSRADSATQVYKQPSSGGTTYTCDVSINNGYGDTVDGSFKVYYDSNTRAKTLLDYSYSVKCQGKASSTSGQGSYTQVSNYEAENDYEIQKCIQYGVNNVLQKAKSNKKISGSNYQITKISNVQKRTQGSGTYYKCSVEVSNKNDCLVTMDINVYDQPSYGTKKLQSYSYDVQKIAKPEQPSSYDYQELDMDQYQGEDNEVQSCLDYGIQQTVNNYQDYSVPKVNGVWKYDIEDSEGGCYYKYDVQLVDNKKSKTVDASYTVRYSPNSQEKQIKTYSCTVKGGNGGYGPYGNYGGYGNVGSYSSSSSGSYSRLSSSKVYGSSKYSGILKYGVSQCLKSLYDNNVITDTNDYSISGLKNALVKTENQGESYKFRVNVKNKIGVSLDAYFDVNYNSYNARKTLTYYSVKGGSPVNYGNLLIADYNVNSQNSNNYEVDVGTYEKISSTDLNLYPDAQDCVNYGVREVVKKAASTERYSSNDFSVKEIKNVCKEKDNGTNYKVDATLTNSRGVTIDCSFSVDGKNGKKLTSYSYASY